MHHTVALFGEAGKGEFKTAYFCKTIEELSHYLGEPPSSDCKGLECAVQALLFKRDVLFFRVHEEGFSIQDYLLGLQFLEDKTQFPLISALCLPGVGSTEIIEASHHVCNLHRSFLILSQKDMYDFLTYRV